MQSVQQPRVPGVQVALDEHHHDGGQDEGDGVGYEEDGAQHTANNVLVMQEKYCPSGIDGEQRGGHDGLDGEGDKGAEVQCVQAAGHGRDGRPVVPATPQHGQVISQEQNGSQSSMRKKKNAKRRIVAIKPGLVQSRISDFVLKFPTLGTAQPYKKLNFKENIKVQPSTSVRTKAPIGKKRKIGGDYHQTNCSTDQPKRIKTEFNWEKFC